MDDTQEHSHQLRALAMRVAALEENVAFLEEWCEEQQDLLDRAVGPVPYDYETGVDRPPVPRASLRVVDLRDVAARTDEEDARGGAETIVAVVETEHDRRVRLMRLQLNRLRTRLASSLAPAREEALAAEGRPQARKVSGKPAGRTAP